MPIFGPPNIQKMKEEGNVKGLLKALRNKDNKIVWEAGIALVEFGVYSPFSLIYGVSDPDYKIREKTYIAYAALVHYGFIPLVASLYDPNESVRLASISAFLIRQDPRATEVLGKCLLLDPSSKVREFIVQTMVKISGFKSYDYLLKAKNDPNNEVKRRIRDELNKASIPVRENENEASIQKFTNNQFSIYSLWQGLHEVLLIDFKEIKARFPTYSSPLANSCKVLMEKAGDAIKLKDEKTAYKYLWNIDHATQESLDFNRKYSNNETINQMSRQCIEYNQASKLLISKLLKD